MLHKYPNAVPIPGSKNEDPEAAPDAENPGEESRVHDDVQNAIEEASAAEKNNLQNAGSSTPGNVAGAVPQKDSTQAKDKAGGNT